MQALARFFAFWYDFIVGDDWTLAVGVVVALFVSAAVARSDAAALAWIVMPLAIALTLCVSLRLALRPH